MGAAAVVLWVVCTASENPDKPYCNDANPMEFSAAMESLGGRMYYTYTEFLFKSDGTAIPVKVDIPEPPKFIRPYRPKKRSWLSRLFSRR